MCLFQSKFYFQGFCDGSVVKHRREVTLTTNYFFLDPDRCLDLKMTDLYSDYHRKTSNTREDPRLARRSKSTNNSNDNSKQISPSVASPAKETSQHISDMNWQNQYNSATMQTAYQHLPPSMYADVSC